MKSHPGQLNYYYEIHQIKLQFESYTRRDLRNLALSLGIEVFGKHTKHQESRNKDLTGDLTELANFLPQRIHLTLQKLPRVALLA